MAIKITGAISERSPRRAAWLEIFGTETIPLVAPLPHKGKGPDGEAHEFYKMDLKALIFARSTTRPLRARKFSGALSASAASISAENNFYVSEGL